MNFGSWNMSNIKNESEVIPIALYSEKIAENDRKIEQLSKNIKRDTEKRKKLMEENGRPRTAMTLRSTISRTAIMTKMPERSQGIFPVTDGTIF